MESILGLLMFYAWIHGTVIVVQNLNKTTSYEKVVLWAGFASFILYIIGTVSQ